MASVSEEDLQAKREHVEKLRSQLADARTKAESNAIDMSNEVTAKQLDAEAAQLEAELAIVRAESTKPVLREANADVISAARDDVKAAGAQVASVKEGQ